jgi:LPXTG-motif cell wall-anchored protein
MYVYGKGKSATTVSAPLTAITQGQSVVLMGTVLDQSPAQPGTPCVSADSMATYMEYLHMQKAIPANVTVIGVPVSIDAVYPNGDNVHIATVTSDMSGTFGYTWTPTIAGQYKITASFMGDDSYGSSWAQTYAAVVEAPASTATPTATPVATEAPTATPTATASPSPAPNPETGPSTDMYLIAAAAVVVIVVVAIAAFVLRKRK